MRDDLRQPPGIVHFTSSLLHVFTIFRQNGNLDAATLHRLPGAYLGCLATLRLTVHLHLAGGDQALSLPAAFGNARQLEQIAEPDVLIVQLKLDGVHAAQRIGVARLNLSCSRPAARLPPAARTAICAMRRA